MQFKHPELLYALFLLLIPIIIHLFQLRRFQKVAFTNVQFLKQVTLQTRKSSQLKKWLTLLTRLLLLAAIIFAFAQPYKSKLQDLKTNTETVIYLDNSFSMQAKGEKGALLKRAVQDIISALNDDDKLSVFTNNSAIKSASKKTIKAELLQLKYSANQLDYNAVILKGKQFFNKKNTSIKQLVLLSDFQQQQKDFNIVPDTLMNLSLVQLQPVNKQNISIDSVYISKTNLSTIELTVLLKLQDQEMLEDISISLFNNDKLIAKTAVNVANGLKGTFSLPNNTEINGRFEIEDANLLFDNILFFNINQRAKVRVLSINSEEDNYLNRVYSEDEFEYNATDFKQLNYNEIEQHNLIVLNELSNIPLSLSNALSLFVDNGGIILIIPSNNISLQSYNQFIKKYNNSNFEVLNKSEKKITVIHYSHPIFNSVFDKRVSNFQYPKVNSFYNLVSNSSSILDFENGSPFLIQSGNVFMFSSALNIKNSNFINSPLIVPILYNIGRESLQFPQLYYTIGDENTLDVNTIMLQDDILILKSNAIEIIPQQRTYSNKVTVTTSEALNVAAIYSINNNIETIKNISFNYNRNESNLNYLNLATINNATIKNSIPQFFNDIKSETNVSELWKWFVIFATMLLILEMLILKYFK